MMPTISNQELKRAEDLKNNWKFKEALSFLDNFENKKELTSQELFQFYFLKSTILIDVLDSDEAMIYADLAHKESIMLGSDDQIVKTLILKCHILRTMLETSKCLEMLNEAEEILAKNQQKSSLEFKLMNGYVLLRKGCHYFSIGDINKGLVFLSEASQIANEINNKQLILQTAKWSSFAYSDKGETDLAFEYKRRFLNLAIELNDKQEIIGGHNTLGMEFTEKGEFKRAIEHLEKSLAICSEINSWKTFIVSTSLFDAYIKSGAIKKAQQLHNQMGELVKQGTYKFNEEAYRLQEAILLKKQVNETSLSKAEKIYKEIADKGTDFIEFKIDALLNLCDIYLIRLKKTSKLEELDKIQPYIEEIRILAVHEGVHTLLAEMYLFQAKLKMISYQFKEAQNLLTQALDTADLHGLNLIAKRVEDERAELSKNYIKWEKLRVSGGKISERMDLARIEEQIQILLQKRDYLKGLSSS